MKTPKKKPERKCLGCGEMKDKSQLLRIVRSGDGKISVDRTGKVNGRGAYICASKECFAKCRKAKRFDKAFGVSVPDEIYASLEGMIMIENG